MIRKVIRYTNANGDPGELEAYFHLNKAELIEMTFEIDGGLDDYINKIVESNNNREIYSLFKRIILRAYGVKTARGDFVKDELNKQTFESSEAFSELVVGLMTDELAAAEFMQGILPRDLDGSVMNKKAGKDAVQPTPIPDVLILSGKEIEQMDADELKSGLATGRYRIG